MKSGKKMLQRITIMIFLVSMVTGCYYDQVIPEEPEIDIEVSFSQDIIPIFNTTCNAVGCHSTGGQTPDLTASNAFNSLESGGYIDRSNPPASELYQWMAGNRTIPMPISGSNPKDNALVLKWIEQSALEN